MYIANLIWSTQKLALQIMILTVISLQNIALIIADVHYRLILHISQPHEEKFTMRALKQGQCIDEH